MPLDPSRVPEALLRLLPVAERWGISDDVHREGAVDAASVHDLEALVHSIDGVGEDLHGWLAGPAADDPNPSDEYVAFGALGMAIESAKIELRRRRTV